MVEAQKHLRKITRWTKSAPINKTGLKKRGSEAVWKTEQDCAAVGMERSCAQ